METPTQKKLIDILRRSLRHFGPLHWWPGESPFEICIGAILTQNTAWKNVERALDNMKMAGLLSVEAIIETEQQVLAEAIRSSGYFNMKAVKLRTFCLFLKQHRGIEGLDKFGTAQLRQMLLAVKGIGPETADDMLLYAFHRPVFVVDAYTRRILERHGVIRGDEDYHAIQDFFHCHLPHREGLFNEYHAQIVYLGKTYCRRTKPDCEHCPLRSLLPR